MADLNVTADFRDVEQLQAILGRLGPEFGKAVARIQREMKQMENATKASASVLADALDQVVGASAQRDLQTWGQAQKRRLALMQESEKIALRQADAEKRISTELLRQRDASEQLARANAQRVQSGIGGALGLGAQGISASAAAGTFEAEIERLRNKYDEVYRSAQIYEQALNEINQAHAMGAISSINHAKAVDRLNQEYNDFQNNAVQGANRFAAAADRSAGYTNQWGVVTQQAGYQVGDFLVQIQSGTNWMVAFGQQATQLVGVLPLMSGALGMSVGALTSLAAGLGIAIPLFTAVGAYFLRTGESAANATPQIDLYTEALKASATEVERLNQELLEMRFPDLSDSQRLLRVQLDEAKLAAEELRAKLEEVTNGPNYARKGQVLQVISSELDAAVDKANELEKAYKNIADRQKQLAEGASEAARFEERRRQIAESILGPLRRELELRNQARESAKQLKSVLDAINGMAINVGVNFQAAYSGFTGQAQQWFQGLVDSGWSSSNPGQMNSSPRPQSAPSGIGGIDWGSSGSGGGGGGGGEDPFKAKWEQLQEYLKSEAELEIENFEEREKTLKSALDRKLITIQEYNEMEKKLKEEHNAAMDALDDYRYGSGLAKAELFFGEMADAFQGGNEKMQRIGKVFAGIEATINAYRAFNQTLADPSLPWYAKIPKAVAVLAAGMQTVQAIRGASGGGGSRPGVGTSSVSSQSAAPSPQTVYINSLDPAGLYSGQMLINLFDAFYDENDKRGKVFVVGK